MPDKFYPVKIAAVTKETSDCVSVSFDIPAHLAEIFRYRHGQYLTLRTQLQQQEVRRSYSLCSSPLDGQWKVAIKKVPGGLFSSFANELLQPGDVIELMPPRGKFSSEIHPDHTKNYMAFAAGSGITPLLSIIKTTLRSEPGSSFTLVYGNRRQHHIIFKEELEALKNRFIDRFRVYHIFSREKTEAALNQGRIDAEKCRYIFDKLVNAGTIDEFFLCGPEEMIFGIRAYLLGLDIDDKKIRFELFATKNAKPLQTGKTIITDDGPSSRIFIRKDGVESSFLLSYEGPSILDAALREGADLPFACKGGVCCTCKARLLEGQVTMDVNYGLEPEEVEQGYILTCQSHPTTEMVKLDYD